MKEDTITILKELANKYNIRSGTDKSFFLLLAASYNLPKEKLEKLLNIKEENFTRIHTYLLSLILMQESEQEKLIERWNKGNEREPLLDRRSKSIIHNKNEQGENNENNEKSEAEELDDFLREYYCPDKGDKRYDRVRKEIINSKTLTATQIEAVNQVIDAGIPEDEVLTMIRMNKEANVMRKYVELVGRVEKNKFYK